MISHPDARSIFIVILLTCSTSHLKGLHITWIARELLINYNISYQEYFI